VCYENNSLTQHKLHIISGLPDGILAYSMAIWYIRWYVFKKKAWVNFGGPWHEKRWYILWPFGLYYGRLVYFMDIWYILWQFCNLVAIWYTFPCFGLLNKETSGNPVSYPCGK
jgi:hypothetical protein